MAGRDHRTVPNVGVAGTPACRDGSVGFRVRRLREGLGLTQEDCACACGIAPKNWALLEEGKRGSLRSTTLTEIVLFFRKESVALSADWLLGIEMKRDRPCPGE